MGTSGRLLALGFGNFIIGTGTLIVPGMLPALARGLDVTLPVAGGLITAFAVTIAVSAPILAGATSRIDRRRLLVATQLYYAAGHLVAATISDFGAMMAVRAVTSLAAGLYTAQAAATASLLVPAEARGRALAFVFLGWAIASVLGLPLGAYVGSTVGWRAGFLLVAGGALASTLALWIALPSALRVKPIDRAMWRSLLGHRRLLMVVGVTVLVGAGQFTIFSYLVPAMKAFVAASPTTVSLLLAALGAAAVAGNAFGGGLADRFGAARVVAAALVIMALGHLAWTRASGDLPLLVVALVVWGVPSFASNSIQQVRLATISPAHAPVSIAFNSSAIFLGQAIGTFGGGLVLARIEGASGYAALPWISIPLFAGAVALSIAAERVG